MNEWVLVKGCILGLWIDGLCVVITTSVEWLMAIQVGRWIELPKQRGLYSIFCENMNPDK